MQSLAITCKMKKSFGRGRVMKKEFENSDKKSNFATK
jgi:hypothetical protein